MRILYLTQYFPPEIGAPQVRIPELMRHMVRLGHQVTILTAMPNYPKGRVFPGYRGRAFMSEPFEDMRVVRTFMYPTLSVGFIRRTTSQISFAASSALLGLWKVGRQDVILAGSPPLFIAPSALVLSRALGCPYIAVVADLWPEIAIETGILKSRPGIRMAQGLERMLYRYAVAVLTQTPGQALNIRERFPATRVDVLSGGVNTSLYAPSLRSDAIRAEFGVSSRVAVAFVGLHGFAQGLDVVLNAADHLRHRADIAFVLIGSGAEKDQLSRRATGMNLPNLKFFDPVPRERVPAILASMDIALVSLRHGVPRATIPSKMYEAMASGLPIVVAADGEANDLVRDEQIGYAVPAGAGGDLAAAIQGLAEDPAGRGSCGQRAFHLARTRYDRVAIGARLHQLLTEIVGGPGSVAG
jgi:glycosyltransferase involved in cell wall biosynthesis